jgi:hypothetical protein
MEFKRNQDGKITAMQLVKEFFGANLQEMKGLPLVDREQMASAIASQEGIGQEDLSFTLVAY